MRHLIVAHHDEPLTWLNFLVLSSPQPWDITVVSNGRHRPNVGREAGAYLWYIVKRYEEICRLPYDNFAFVQADPFPHCERVVERLNDQTSGWMPLGDVLYDSDGGGLPHHAGLPVGDGYRRVTGEQFPGIVRFYGGGQFMIRGESIRLKPKSYWQDLADMAADEARGGPWVLERLWAAVFGHRAEDHQAFVANVA